MTIKRADIADARFLCQAMTDLHGKRDIDSSGAQAFLEDPACISFLAVDSGRIVGSLYGYALRRPETLRPKFFLYEIDVVESHQRQGIGRQLLEAFLSEAHERNAIGAWVQAKSLDANAQSFYKACGGSRDEDGDILFTFST